MSISGEEMEVMGRASILLDKLKKRGLDPEEFDELRRLQSMCPHNSRPVDFMHNGEDCESCGMHLGT